MVSLIGWILFGLIARSLVPGLQPMACLRTILLGVAGLFVGGLIGYFSRGGDLI